MKKLIIGSSVLIFALCLIPMLVFSAGQQEEVDGEIELKVWINGSDSYIGPEEQKRPQEEWYISKAFERFEEENPGVSIELTVPPDQEGAHQSFKAAVVGGNAPDVANLWTGQNIFSMKDAILDITDMVPEEDLEKIAGWEGVRLGFDPDGKIIGYPASQNQICMLLYNKAIVEEAGLDFENDPPRTFEEFDEALADIKELGVDPIVVDESFPWFFAWIGDYWWVQVTGSEDILAETKGEKKFTEDEGLLNALEYYRSLYKNGFFNEDMGTSVDSWNRFLQEKGAMTPVVTSFYSDAKETLGEDLGILMPPDAPNAKQRNSTVGGPGQSLVVSKDTDHPEMAVKLMSFLNSKEEVIRAQEYMEFPPVRKDITAEELGWGEDSELAKVLDYTTKYIYWPDNLLTGPVAETYYKLTPMVALGEMTPMELVEELESDSGSE